MRTIYYNDEDIKKCKLALVNQNLTSLQSAFLKQYINNLEYELQQKEDVIKQLLTYLDKNKLTLNNPNILDFYINVKKILNIEKSDNE